MEDRATMYMEEITIGEQFKGFKNLVEFMEFWEDDNIEYYKTAYFDKKAMADVG